MYIQRKGEIEGNFNLQLLCDLFGYICFPSGQFNLFKLFLLLEVIAIEFKHYLQKISYIIILN